VNLKFCGGCWGYILDCMAGMDVLGLLARSRTRSPNLAENFERYVIFFGTHR
jgi:hypothetical protein